MTVRELVLQEARRWLGARWQHTARRRYKAVDCGQLLLDVYVQCGIIADVSVQNYPRQWALHQSDERYMTLVQHYADPVSAPQPADIVVFKVGRAYSHGGIVIDWPRIIHAHSDEGVVEADVSMGGLAMRDKLFFDVCKD